MVSRITRICVVGVWGAEVGIALVVATVRLVVRLLLVVMIGTLRVVCRVVGGIGVLLGMGTFACVLFTSGWRWEVVA